MKQCPVCEKTFDDSLRFCQADGTPLVDKAEPVDPYKTMVASKEEIAAAMPKAPVEAKPVPEPTVPAPLENEVLEIPPAADPNKTQVVTEEELRAEMAKISNDENEVIDMPPAASGPSEPSEPGTRPSPFGDSPSTPPSPFAASSEEKEEPGPANFPTTPPIPSPFNAELAGSKPEPAKPETPTVPPFAPPAESKEPLKPFEQPAQAAPMAQAEFNPPAESNMQNPQNFGQAPAPAGQNKTLSIIALVLGIAGLTICCGTFLPSLLAVILGFMGRSKANQDPAQYGGAGLALGGIITGAIGLLGGVIAWIVYVFWFAAIMASMPR